MLRRCDQQVTPACCWIGCTASLIPMPADVMCYIFAEVGHDFSSDVCPGATLADLDEAAINAFREKWIQKSGRTELATRSIVQLLTDAEATRPGGGVTYAVLVLFGTHQALGRLLVQCEVVFQYQSTEASGPAQQRVDFRQGFH